MNARELTIEIARLRSQVEKNEQLVDHQLRRVNEDLGQIKSRLYEMENLQHDLDKRLSILEKGSDQFWRIAPMVLSSLAIFITLVIAFVKK